MTHVGESLPLLAAVAVVVAVVAPGLAVIPDEVEAGTQGVNLDDTDIEAGSSFTVSYFDDAADDGGTIHVVVDDTDGLDGNFTVYVYEGSSSLSTGTDLTSAGSAEVSIDGEPPWISQFDLVNASGEALRVTMVADERLQTHEVGLSGPESATLTSFQET